MTPPFTLVLILSLLLSLTPPPEHTCKRLRGGSESSPSSSHGPTGSIHFLSSTPSFPYSPALHFCLVFSFFLTTKLHNMRLKSGKMEELKAFLKTVTIPNRKFHCGLSQHVYCIPLVVIFLDGPVNGSVFSLTSCPCKTIRPLLGMRCLNASRTFLAWLWRAAEWDIPCHFPLCWPHNSQCSALPSAFLSDVSHLVLHARVNTWSKQMARPRDRLL